MKIILSIITVLVLLPAMALSSNIVRQMGQSSSAASPRLACKSPKFGFNAQEIELCINVYQSCMRSDLKLYERDRCVINAVKNPKKPQQQSAGQKNASQSISSSVARTRTLTFTFDAFQAYDLVEMCEEKKNSRRSLCAAVIIPNKPKIISDINAARR